MDFKKINPEDLRDSSSLFSVVRTFNRRLNKRMSSCRMQVITPDLGSPARVIKGGVKVILRVREPVKVVNRICLEENKTEEFLTYFKFTTDSVLIIPATNQDSATDLLSKFRQKFNILQSCQLFLYEQEFSEVVKKKNKKKDDIEEDEEDDDIFNFKRIKDEEIPLELNLIWSVNRERKSIVLSDRDLGKEIYEGYTMEQLKEKLNGLATEEDEAVISKREQFALLRRRLQEAIAKEEEKAAGQM